MTKNVKKTKEVWGSVCLPTFLLTIPQTMNLLSKTKVGVIYEINEGGNMGKLRGKELEEEGRCTKLAAWLQWCLDNCDDSPEWNFGTTATEHMRNLLAGKDAPMPPN